VLGADATCRGVNLVLGRCGVEPDKGAEGHGDVGRDREVAQGHVARGR